MELWLWLSHPRCGKNNNKKSGRGAGERRRIKKRKKRQRRSLHEHRAHVDVAEFDQIDATARAVDKMARIRGVTGDQHGRPPVTGDNIP